MVRKPKYDWDGGALLDDHSKRKLKILQEYFFDYVRVRCSFPHQRVFRLAVIDGFSGGGRYRCGTPGSPIVFIETLQAATASINTNRAIAGLQPLAIECLMVFNDTSSAAINALQQNLAPLLAEIRSEIPQLQLRVEFKNKPFSEAYPEIQALVDAGSFQNVLVNLDQYGHREIERTQLAEMMNWSRSVEIFYTFSMAALLTFLNKRNPEALEKQLRHMQLSHRDFAELHQQPTTTAWLGAAERIVFSGFQTCAPFVSPFSINNPSGWEYWLIHFAKSRRARQVYNNILHKNAEQQAHFGRSGLHMLSYDPAKEGQLYLFDHSARKLAFEQLCDDIPRLVLETGDTMEVGDFYDAAYNTTPAHADDINRAIIESEDIEIFTASGGERRTPNNIADNDILRVKRQLRLFSSPRVERLKI